MSGTFPVVTSKELLTALERAGFFDRTKGSHYYLMHPERPELRVSLPYHNKDLRRGTIKNLLNQARLTVEDLVELLDRKRAA